MKYDPFTLRIALDNKGSAKGELYLDDGETFSHQSGQFVWRGFSAESKNGAISVLSQNFAKAKPSEAVDGVALAKYDNANEFAQSVGDVRVEKIVVLGLKSKPVSVVKKSDGVKLEWTFTPGVDAAGKKEGQASELVVKDPGAKVTADWEITVTL